MSGYRIEKDSLGELKVPDSALWGAQTQRAVNNFPISGRGMPAAFIQALGLIKSACAAVNGDLEGMDASIVTAIQQAAQEVSEGKHNDQFPVDVFQTGSGTSSNMNANEVIAHLASQISGLTVHPNDHVNKSQSSNDVIPTALHVSACIQIEQTLLPALAHLRGVISQRSEELNPIVKTGRTHLMDAMPLSMGQELGGWAAQVELGEQRITDSLKRLRELTLGGTAVGTGINTPKGFGEHVATQLAAMTGIDFSSKNNYFEGLSAQDSAVEMSGQLKTLAVSLMKIANDLRWMNSGPLAGLGEISLPALQPGSSIMPGKVNPVIPEAVTMVCAQVIGNDAAITCGGQAGNFQLNVMLPMIADNILEQIELLANASTTLADKAIAGFTINVENINTPLERNPILVTALNNVIGYELGAQIAKTAYKEKRPVIEVAKELTELSESELHTLLNPKQLTGGG